MKLAIWSKLGECSLFQQKYKEHFDYLRKITKNGVGLDLETAFKFIRIYLGMSIETGKLALASDVLYGTKLIFKKLSHKFQARLGEAYEVFTQNLHFYEAWWNYSKGIITGNSDYFKSSIKYYLYSKDILSKLSPESPEINKMYFRIARSWLMLGNNKIAAVNFEQCGLIKKYTEPLQAFEELEKIENFVKEGLIQLVRKIITRFSIEYKYNYVKKTFFKLAKGTEGKVDYSLQEPELQIIKSLKILLKEKAETLISLKQWEATKQSFIYYELVNTIVGYIRDEFSKIHHEIPKVRVKIMKEIFELSHNPTRFFETLYNSINTPPVPGIYITQVEFSRTIVKFQKGFARAIDFYLDFTWKDEDVTAREMLVVDREYEEQEILELGKKSHKIIKFLVRTFLGELAVASRGIDVVDDTSFSKETAYKIIKQLIQGSNISSKKDKGVLYNVTQNIFLIYLTEITTHNKEYAGYNLVRFGKGFTVPEFYMDGARKFGIIMASKLIAGLCAGRLCLDSSITTIQEYLMDSSLERNCLDTLLDSYKIEETDSGCYEMFQPLIEEFEYHILGENSNYLMFPIELDYAVAPVSS